MWFIKTFSKYKPAQIALWSENRKMFKCDSVYISILLYNYNIILNFVALPDVIQ